MWSHTVGPRCPVIACRTAIVSHSLSVASARHNAVEECACGHLTRLSTCRQMRGVWCLQDLFIRSGGDASHFDANHIFSPHITLGFTAASATKGLFAPTDLFIENVRPTPSMLPPKHLLRILEGCLVHPVPWPSELPSLLRTAILT